MSILGNTTAITPSGDSSDLQPQVAPQAAPPASVTGGIVPAAASAEAAVNGPSQTTPPSQPAAPAQPTSRLAAIVQAVANVASTALTGIPVKGRPSFATGLGEGARAEQQAVANQQAIKFKTFDDQVRLAQLHNQDLKMQQDTQAQQDAHNEAELHMREMANNMGLDYDSIANHGSAVMDHLTAQTATNGAASVPAGTHISADGQSIYVPKNPDSQQTRDAQKQMYKELAPALGLPSLPPNAQFVPPKSLDMLTNKMLGFDLGGHPYDHNTLPGIIAATQAQRDNLAKNGGSPNQLKALDNVLNVYKANLNALDEHAQTVADQASQRKQEEQTNQIQQKGEQQRLTNAAKPQKPQSTDWVQGATADEKKKAELAENMVFNANNIASILQRRPDIVGKVAGRITNVEQMAGTNDPDIVQLGTDIHNIAMANNGIHGLRSAEAVKEFENKLLNNFKNGPRGIAGGLMGSVNSVQTFIDNARPETYKTHSKQGGAIKAMVPNQ